MTAGFEDGREPQGMGRGQLLDVERARKWILLWEPLEAMRLYRHYHSRLLTSRIMCCFQP